MAVGKEVKRYLQQHGISQTFLARKSGIKLPKLNQTLNNKRPMSADEFIAICQALDVPPNKFIP